MCVHVSVGVLCWPCWVGAWVQYVVFKANCTCHAHTHAHTHTQLPKVTHKHTAHVHVRPWCASQTCMHTHALHDVDSLTSSDVNMFCSFVTIQTHTHLSSTTAYTLLAHVTYACTHTHIVLSFNISLVLNQLLNILDQHVL